MAKWWEREEERIIRKIERKAPTQQKAPQTLLAVAAFNALFKERVG